MSGKLRTGLRSPGARLLVGIGAVAGAVVAATACLLPTPASASTSVDIRGVWSEVATVGTSNFPQTVTYVTEDFTTGAITGTDVGGGATYTVTGIIDGVTVTTDIKSTSGAYASHAVGTVTRSGGTLVMAGTFTDTVNHKGGTFTATLISPANTTPPTTTTTIPEPKTGNVPTATMVICNRDMTQPNQGVFQCNAFVADASGHGHSHSPTGTVTWTDTVGAFARRTSCVISTANVGVAGCSVSFTTSNAAVPIGTAPPVTASYSGDATFAPSRGVDQLGPASDLSQYEEMSLAPNGPQTSPVTSTKPACVCGDPVDPGSGNLALSTFDIIVPGRGVGLAMVRTYNSAMAGVPSRFGAGWTDGYNLSIERRESGGVTVHLDSGAAIPFAASSSGYVAPAWVTATLSPGPAGSFVLRFANQSVVTFNSAGRMTALADRTGEVTSLTYNGDGTLAAASDSFGRSLKFSSDSSGRVTRTTDPAGRTVNYAYDTAGNLVSVTDVAGNVTGYRYDAQHHLTSLTDPLGSVSATTYDGSGRVIQQTDPLGNKLTFSYAGSFPNVITTVTDGSGSHEEYTYRGGVLVGQTAGAGSPEAARWSYVYDTALNVVASVDPNGHVWQSSYDAAGNVLTTTDPLGRTELATYNTRNDPTKVVDPLGLVTEVAYDANGLPTRVVHAAGTPVAAATVIEYANPAHPGDITAVTDPVGAVTKYAYDAYGDVATVTDAAGGVASAAYDTIGHPTAVTGPRGHVAGASASVDTTTSTSDAWGNPLTSTDALGNLTTYKYDANQSLISLTDASGATVTTAYDADGRPITQTTADGSTQHASRDAVGELVTQTDAAGHVTSMTYDALHRLTSWTDQLGHTWRMEHDPAGNITAVIDAKGATRHYSYDGANQLVGVSYDDAGTAGVAYAYDADGRRVSMTDGTGTTTYTYDEQSRLVSTTDGAGHTVSETYDLRGGVTAIGYPGGLTVGHTYDVLGRLTAVTDGVGHINRFAYDPDGNLISSTLGNGTTVTNAYDNGNELSSMAYAASGSATPYASFGYQRDNLGRVTALSGPAAGGVARATYDAAHRLASLGGQTFASDAAGNLTSLRASTLNYNSAGQLTGSTGTVSANFTYDADGRRVTARASGGMSMSYQFDQAGHLVGVGKFERSSGGTFGVVVVVVFVVAAVALFFLWRRRRFHRGRIATAVALLALAVAGIGVAGASLAGVAVAGTSAGSPTVGYAYNGDGLRVTATSGSATIATFTWLQTGGIPTLLGDGVHRFVAGPGGMPLEQIDASGSAQWLNTDQLGSVRVITDTSGVVSATMTYDAYGQATARTGAATSPLGFDGQYTDATTGFQYLRARYYDPATAQFLTVDPMVVATHHAYAFAAGNPLNITDPSGADPVGQPVSPAGPSAPVDPPHTVLAGHGTMEGGLSRPTPTLTVPEGTTMIFHQPYGSAMTDDYGVMIEQGQPTNYNEVYGPGSVIPDYTLHAPTGLAVQPTSVTVSKDTLLSKLLKPNMGTVDWAACRSGLHKNLRPTWPQTGKGVTWDNSGPILNYRAIVTEGAKPVHGEIPDPSWWGWDTMTPLPPT